MDIPTVTSRDTAPASANQGFRYCEQIDASDQGRRLVDHLSARYAHSDRADWVARLERGELAIDGRPAHVDEELRAGQIVSWDRPPWVEPAAPSHFTIVYEDESLLVVDKPSGLPTLPGGGFLTHTLLALVRARDPGWSPAHRLGRATSGLVAMGRTPEARARLQESFLAGRVEKRYLALAQGQLLAPQAIQVPIGPVPHPLLGTVHAASGSGKASETRVERVEPRGADSLAQLRILTGRPHQIRIHLAAAGHPLVGDPLYETGGLPRADALPGDSGYQLHAWRLALPHPTTGNRLELEAPIPAGLQS